MGGPEDRLEGWSLGIAPEIAGAVCLGLVAAEPVRVEPAGPALRAAMESLSAELRQRYAGRKPSEIGPLVYARELYRRFGVDPTRVRPSSEALLRRVLRGEPLPVILNAVDVANYCSLHFLLPLGLYDAERVEPPVALRLGRPGESYAGIRKDEVHLGGRLVLADRRGPFGNPTSDSWRTRVREETSALVLVVFAPPSYPRERLAEHVSFAREAMGRFLPARAGQMRTAGSVLPAPPPQ